MQKKPGSPRKSLQSSTAGMDVDVYSLSDRDLADMLRKMGENPGPIMGKTSVGKMDYKSKKDCSTLFAHCSKPFAYM